MHRPGPGGDGGIAYGGPYGGGGYGGDELACTLRGLALGGEHLPGSPYDAYAHALPAMSPRAAGQDAYNDASAHADLLFDAQDVSWLRAAYGQGFDPERLLAGEAVPAEHARQPMSPGYHRCAPRALGDCIAAACRELRPARRPLRVLQRARWTRHGALRALRAASARGLLPQPPRRGGPWLRCGAAAARPDRFRPRSLYKTELCRSYEETSTCRYGSKCQARSRPRLFR